MSGLDQIRSILEDFVDDLDDHLNPQKLEKTLKGEYSPDTPDLGRKPETWHYDRLVDWSRVWDIHLTLFELTCRIISGSCLF